MKPISYDISKTLRSNINRYLKENNTTTSALAKRIPIAPNTINAYVAREFLTENKKESRLGNKIKALVASLFIGGLPKQVFLPKKRENLYAAFGCASCEYRMRQEAGCFKFGLTKAEINAGHFVETREHGGFRLSTTKRCPHERA